MTVEKAINKYCAYHAEVEIEQLQHFPSERLFHHVVVVPAYREAPNFLARLQRLGHRNACTLIVLVINQPESDTDAEFGNTLLEAARRSGNREWESSQLQLVAWKNGSCILLVDRFASSLRIPHKQGVGLARKIGCDLAVALRRRGNLQATFIHNTDADATLPSDYLVRTAKVQNASAVLYPFQHDATDQVVGQATRIYEESLHYYVRGLRWAGSPYAFHTLGSCVAISLFHYCLARGFPKRAGGEDFYLLNKLAKLAPVIEITGPPITLQARESSRVPFGTGPAVARILALESPADFRTYDPRIFVELAELLRRFPALWACSQLEDDQYQGWLNALPARIREACLALGIEQLLRHLSTQANSEAQCRKHTHDWFDAFRSLKFIHYMQEQHYPPVALNRAISDSKALFD